MSLSNHPARKLAAWLKGKRRRADIVARVFAGQIGLAPAEYAEVEAGVVRWIGKEEERLIVDTLVLSVQDAATFRRMLANARNASVLDFEDIFSRDELEPVRTRSNKKQLSKKNRDAILDAVFTPLS